jgi:hypothetical protein
MSRGQTPEQDGHLYFLPKVNTSKPPAYHPRGMQLLLLIAFILSFLLLLEAPFPAPGGWGRLHSRINKLCNSALLRHVTSKKSFSSAFLVPRPLGYGPDKGMVSP